MMVAPTITTIRESITAHKDGMKTIMGDIAPEAIDNLEGELGDILVKFKSHHFLQGQKIGYLGVISGEDWMRTIYGTHGTHIYTHQSRTV